MMTVPAGTQIWIAAGVTDLRRGFTGLSAIVQTKLEQDPFGGHVFVFRGRRGDLIKVLWWDGDGLCLFAKRIERGRFVWPKADNGTVALTKRAKRVSLNCAIFCRRSPKPHGESASYRAVSEKREKRCLRHRLIGDTTPAQR